MRPVWLLLGLLAVGCGDGGGGGGTCALGGHWSGVGGGASFSIDFAVDGTFALAIPAINGNVAGTWTLTGSMLLLSDNGCTTSGSGSYSVSFGSSCTTATLAKLADTCSDRITTFNGTTLHR